MRMLQVESSNIAKIGYDPETKTLAVEFHGGRVHRYADVPPETYAEFMSAHSHGQYFARHIRGTYSSSRDEAPPKAVDHVVIGIGTYPPEMKEHMDRALDESFRQTKEAVEHDHVAALEAAARRFRGEQ